MTYASSCQAKDDSVVFNFRPQQEKRIQYACCTSQEVSAVGKMASELEGITTSSKERNRRDIETVTKLSTNRVIGLET